jgi:hypothetical protein
MMDNHHALTARAAGLMSAALLGDEATVRALLATETPANHRALAQAAARVLRAANQSGDSITCPACLRTSHNPNDVREGYCGACHRFTSPPAGARPTNGDTEMTPP